MLENAHQIYKPAHFPSEVTLLGKAYQTYKQRHQRNAERLITDIKTIKTYY